MNPEILSELQRARDFPSLTETVLAICGPFGAVHSFSLVHNKAAGRVFCFIELDSVKQHSEMIRKLGAALVSGAVCLEIPMGPHFVACRRVRLMSFTREIESTAQTGSASTTSWRGTAPEKPDNPMVRSDYAGVISDSRLRR